MEKVTIATIWLLTSLVLQGQVPSQDSAGYRTVRVDDKNHRAFVVVKPEILSKHSELCTVLRRVLADVSTGSNRQQWVVSLFENEELANYKDKIPPDQIEQWMRSYLGELEEGGVFWSHPLQASKKKHDLASCLNRSGK